MTGSTGVDRFVYSSIRDSGVGRAARDVITDFRGSLGEKIDLSAIDAYAPAKGNQAFTFIGSSGFTGTKGEVRFSGGILQINTSTDKIADMEIVLTGATDFHSNFLVL
jgi:Ca2+-binding RTX toxin-like protein